MKIYKIAQLIGWDEHDYFESYDDQLVEIIGSFINGDSLEWNPVSLNYLKPIYRYFTRYSTLNDRMTSNLRSVIINIGKNIARLRVTTELVGHGEIHLAELFERAGYEDYYQNFEIPEEEGEEEEDKEEYLWGKLIDFIIAEGQHAISDYGLPKLESLLFRIMNESSAVQQLVLLNQLLDVVHQRNDLASFLVKGGSEALMELSSLEI